mmetsp:Transcript_20747/g.30570  ORF Transcript_20747/g.30570 Transcript_20747/m.30570 type:complete len:228 (-) Transcript_20747:44-727(-)
MTTSGTTNIYLDIQLGREKDAKNVLPSQKLEANDVFSIAEQLSNARKNLFRHTLAGEPKRNNRKERRKKFPDILMRILSVGEFSHIITWMNDEAFVIVKPDKFVSEIMPIFFCKECKFSSFLRKLNRWGFKRYTKKKSINVDFNPTFFHKSFRRDMPGQHKVMNHKNKVPLAGNGEAQTRRFSTYTPVYDILSKVLKQHQSTHPSLLRYERNLPTFNEMLQKLRINL